MVPAASQSLREGVKAAPAGAAILPRVRYLGLDVGDVRIGVALSDETATLASGLVTLERVGPRKDVRAVAALVRKALDRERPVALILTRSMS